MIEHLHHIIPKHMGGSNNPSNLMSVSVEEHAELHLDLYLTHGCWEDWIAYHGLAGIVGHEEVVYFVSEQRKHKTSVSNKIYYRTEEGQVRIQKLIERNRRNKSEEIKQSWKDGKFEGRVKPSGRPKGVKETKPRNKNHRKVRYNGIVYNSATELSQLMGVTPACIRRKCALKLHDFEYV